MHATLGPLAARWDIRQFAVNHRQAPQHLGWQILPNRDIGDRFGVDQIPSIVAAFKPDAVFVFNSFAALPRYGPLPARLGSPRPVLIAQCPVLGEIIDPRLIARLAFFDCVVVLSDVVRRHFANGLAECLRTGMIDRMPRLAVIPHGLDAETFHRLDDRRTARANIPALADLNDDGFVVLNANRHEPRKRIDLTLDGFARFARDKPRNVRLYLHMADHCGDARLSGAIESLGMDDRVVVAAPGTDVHPGLSDSDLNRLYNACDVGINTAASEGWGMVSFEHAATGAAQLVPGCWVCGEMWQDHAELLDVAPISPGPRQYTREAAVSAAGVAAALERLYSNGRHRGRMAVRAATLAAQPRFRWSDIASRWDALLRDLCTSERRAPH
jgi:glycosyltransferase involved in cell wall biosynthesis